MSNRSQASRIPRPTLIVIGSLVVAFIFFFPMFWLFDSSIKDMKEIFVVPPHWWPDHPTLEIYKGVITGSTHRMLSASWPHYFLNSFKVTAIVTALTVALASLAGYGFARFRLRGATALLIFFLVSQMFPGPSILVPVFGVIKHLGLYDQHWGLILLYTAFVLPFTTWMAVGNFRSIPVELEEAAQVDGCSRMGAFVRVVLPISRIGLLTTGVFAFLMSWSEYPFAQIMLNSEDRFTVPVGLGKFVTEFNVYWNDMGAATLLASIPVIVVLFLVQRQFIRGLTEGALTGM